MDLGWGTLLGAGLSLFGGERTNESNARTAARQMEFDAQQAEINRRFSSTEANLNREFQRHQGDNAHLREVADLRRAGLNPILSATGGPGASTPSGATAQGSAARSSGFPAVDSLGNAVSTALAARRNKAEVSNMEADTDLKQTQRSYTSQLWNTSRADEGLINDTAARVRLGTQIEREQLPGAQTEGAIDRSSYGQFLRYGDRLGKSIGSAVGARRLFNQGEKPDPRPKYRGGPWRD